MPRLPERTIPPGTLYGRRSTPQRWLGLKAPPSGCIWAPHDILDELRAEIQPLKSATRRIQPRSTTAISLVGTDGGNNRIEFDPFMVQLIRVVDSSNNEYCLEAVTPTTDLRVVNALHVNDVRRSCLLARVSENPT